MKVTKIAGFTSEENKALIAAGHILGSVADAKEAGEVDVLDEEATSLIAALKDVIGRI